MRSSIGHSDAQGAKFANPLFCNFRLIQVIFKKEIKDNFFSVDISQLTTVLELLRKDTKRNYLVELVGQGQARGVTSYCDLINLDLVSIDIQSFIILREYRILKCTHQHQTKYYFFGSPYSGVQSIRIIFGSLELTCWLGN